MNKIEIVDPRPEWASEFIQVAEQIRTAVGPAATRVDHIGSTAVAHLAAKDVLDIQITVDSLATEQVSQGLVAIGYQLIPNNPGDNLVGVAQGSPELQKLFLLQPAGQRRANIHVREEGRTNQIYPLLFRDYLRADANSRNAYQAVKRELAKRFPQDTEAYYAIKDPYMDTVYRAALLWKDQVGWSPDTNHH